MKRIDSDAVADLFLQLSWSSDIVGHTEAYAAANVNFWRDLLPSRIKDTLMGRVSGDQVSMDLSANDLVHPSGNGSLRTIRNTQFNSARLSKGLLVPRVGRFYPKGILKDIPNIFKGNLEPFRMLETKNGHLTIDTGHPLAGRPIELNVTVGSVRPKLFERGGTVHDWGRIIAEGVGMQARWNQTPSDFFSDDPFVRKDQQADENFYANPRIVAHIDAAASDMVRQIYSRFTTKGMHVLDLMSSWDSHLPEDTPFSRIFGIGLNAIELSQNRQLTDYAVFDLNLNGHLPIESNSFDLAVCTVSIEYLTSPIAIYREIARVLRPGGWFVVTFSNRWFETKAVRIWSELHEFERMGLVLEYFRQSEKFTDLETYSIQGLERPAADKYHGKIAHSDPIYAVWGRTLS